MFLKNYVSHTFLFSVKNVLISNFILTFLDLNEASGCNYLGIQPVELKTNPQVAGAIGKKENFWWWKNILRSTKEVLGIVQHGYKPNWKDGIPPPQSFLPNNQSALKNPELVESQLYQFEVMGCIRRIKSKAHTTMPLSTVFSNKWRLIIDASLHHSPYYSFKNKKLYS